MDYNPGLFSIKVTSPVNWSFPGTFYENYFSYRKDLEPFLFYTKTGKNVNSQGSMSLVPGTNDIFKHW